MNVRQDKKPNPQGKGQDTGISLLVEQSASIGLPDIREDSEEKIVQDFLSSLFVVSCDFKFNPVRGREYYIYSHNNRMLLSLVSPTEGGVQIYEKYMGKCYLKKDFTWSLLLEQENHLTLSSDHKGLAAADSLSSIDELMKKSARGRYDYSLGYYQNVLNFILGKSVKLRSDRLLALGSERMREPAQLI